MTKFLIRCHDDLDSLEFEVLYLPHTCLNTERNIEDRNSERGASFDSIFEVEEDEHDILDTHGGF